MTRNCMELAVNLEEMLARVDALEGCDRARQTKTSEDGTW